MESIGDLFIVSQAVSEPGEAPMSGLYARIWERPQAERGGTVRHRIAAMFLCVAQRLVPVGAETPQGYRPLVASDG